MKMAPQKLRRTARGAIPSESGSTKLSALESAPLSSSDDANSLPSRAVEAPLEVASLTEPAVTHKAVKAAKRKNAVLSHPESSSGKTFGHWRPDAPRILTNPEPP